MVDAVQFVLGAFVLWVPGLAATWAFASHLDLPKFVAASVVVALTIGPATIYILSAFFSMAVTSLNMVLVNLTLAALFAAVALRPRLRAL